MAHQPSRPRLTLLCTVCTLIVTVSIFPVPSHQTALEGSLQVRPSKNGHAEAPIPTFLISLPQSKERRALLEPVLLQHAANVTRVHAFDGRRLPATLREDIPHNCNVEGFQHFNITLPQSCMHTTPIQLAVAMSHLKAVLEAYASGEQLALIMEDDMHVVRWPNRSLIATAPPDWEILLLYMMGHEAETLYLSPPGLWVPWHPFLYSAGAYIIHRPAMLRIIDTYLPGSAQSGKIHQVDLSPLSAYWEQPLSCQSERVVFSAVKTYVCTDFTIVEHSGESTLDRSHRALHDSTATLVQHIMQERGFSVSF